jgi:hypothetical protein
MVTSAEQSIRQSLLMNALRSTVNLPSPVIRSPGKITTEAWTR